MSQKKPTTNEQLEEMRQAIANLEPGKVVTMDRALQERNTSLMLMLYGATAKYGVGMRNGNVIVTAQVPVLQVPAGHSLQWEVAEDGKTVMLYIVIDEDSLKEGRTDKAEASPAEGTGGLEASEPAPEPLPEPLPDTIGDEFEDEIKVGLDGD